MPHIAAFEAQECPGVIDVRCNCGWYACAIYGQQHAESLFSRHKEVNGDSPVVVPLGRVL